MQNILILGIGNIFLRDDGVGVHVIEHLRSLNLPHDVDVLVGGSRIFDCLDLLVGRQQVIIVDAVQGGAEPGAIYRFTPDSAEVEGTQVTSLHEIGLMGVVALAMAIGRRIGKVTIIGVEPKDIGWGEGLSPEVEAVVPTLAEMIVAEIGGA